ncbi:50S ribosomal protein L24 [Hydrogenothermus marinus]|uniref:Large ribosomal subunit protein uL24 n=1 Tax=Hydrogenothermus marinus TaxID=133270 RepID=A0A3M0B5X8_9AQUI|nr:50S ribosomal protein L24 [Hydrogenothermus marinus]RMA92447.1 LSU ribosomal protein L24P [Hydrogenothermus marinus]
MVKTKLKTGDNVIVITGKEKGKTGKIKKVLRRPNRVMVIVEGINIGKKHLKHIENVQEGGIVEIERPIDISNVALIDPKTGQPTRVGYKIIEEGNVIKKVRVAKKSGEIIDTVWEKTK